MLKEVVCYLQVRQDLPCWGPNITLRWNHVLQRILPGQCRTRQTQLPHAAAQSCTTNTKLPKHLAIKTG